MTSGWTLALAFLGSAILVVFADYCRWAKARRRARYAQRVTECLSDLSKSVDRLEIAIENYHPKEL